MYRLVSFVLLLTILFYGFVPEQHRSHAYQNVSDPQKKGLMIVIIDSLSFQRLQTWMERSPAFREWIKSSHIGAISMRTANGKSVQNEILTMATGVKMDGSASMLIALQADERTDQEYPRFREMTGKELGEQSVYLPYFIAKYGSGLRKDPPTLGEILEQAGLKRKVIGNSDLGPVANRIGALFLADLEGSVPIGVTDSSLLRKQEDYPYGIATDYEKYKHEIANSQEEVVVIELGDLRRFYSFREYMTFPHQEDLQKRIDEEIVSFLLWLDQFSEGRQDLWILSPSVDPDSNLRREWLTPIIEHKAFGRKEGVLTSPTTRQPGIIANVDILPSIMNHFGLKLPDTIEGRAMYSIEGDGVQAEFWRELEKIFYIHLHRSDLLYQVVSLQVLILIGVCALIFLSPRHTVWPLKIGVYALSYVLTIPFVLLILGALAPTLPIWVFHAILLAGGLFTGLLAWNVSHRMLYLIVTGLYILFILADGIMGNPMMERSFLGYDPVIGARFYGIGNEYMGVLIGTSILFLFLIMDVIRMQKGWGKAVLTCGWISLIFLILIYLGLPNGGTNAGGTITWLFTMLLISHAYFPNLWRGRNILVVAGSLFFLFAIFLMFQFFQESEDQSHIGRILHRILADGPWVVFETIQRKLEMNIRLIKISSWSKLFFTSLILGGWFLLRMRRKRNQWDQHDQGWSMAFRTILWASLANLAVNDSGIVAAAGGMLFAVIPLLHITMSERFAVPPAGSSPVPILQDNR